MSNNICDVRAKIAPDEHEFLSALALASRVEISLIVRRLIREYLAAEKRKHTVVANHLGIKGLAGIAGESDEDEV